MSSESHALRLLTARGMSPSKRNLTWAQRREHAAGRLAELGGHMVQGLVRARVVEYGDADAMTPGTMLAEVWVEAGTSSEWLRRANSLLELEARATERGLRLVLAVHRARPRDKLVERLRWAWVRLVG